MKIIIMRKIEVIIKQTIWSIKNIFKPNNYDIVIYNNQKYYIKSSLTGYNKWSLYEKNNEKPIYKNINGKNLKIIHSLKRTIEIFNQNYKFQKNNWRSIDLNKKLGTRLSYINSDNINF